jgi:Fis family transcriptional regulator, factor for inversion stimulation protein
MTKALDPLQHDTLRNSVTNALNDYFSQVEPEHISDLYQMVLTQIEEPLLKVVMHNTRSNQSKASIMLGLNRGTLRTKLKQYDML